MPFHRLLCCLALLLPGGAAAQSRAADRPDRALERTLDSLARGVRGDVGIYVRHLRTGRTAALRADEPFPTASLIKVPILVATFDAVARGALDLRQRRAFADSLRYDQDEDLLAKLRAGDSVPLAAVAMLSITTSDNTAALWLQGLVGGAAVNDWMAREGFAVTRVNSRVPGREADRARFGWGQTTPREMAELLIRIRERRVVSPAASEELYRHLTRIHWTGEALSQLPPWVQVASKQGAVNRSRSEVAVVNAPSGDYAFAVITRDQADSSWTDANEGYVLLRAVSAALWRHFEPRHPWAPAEGARRFKP
ncbi:MAG: serine hydrolase [Gemmatimonadales bacterium]|nr:serine hydrolase [Gemmatimonadales bacterium]